jgi:phosphoglycolate phosphatase-like HAD superfamily hydrolase
VIDDLLERYNYNQHDRRGQNGARGETRRVLWASAARCALASKNPSGLARLPCVARGFAYTEADMQTMIPQTTYLEIVRADFPRGQIRHALFDFDGTLSLIREGWQDVMIPMMVEILRATPRAESETEIYAIVREYVTRLTGKQTIYQMIELTEQVKQRGGAPLEPLAYKRMYHDLLMARIQHRIADLENGRAEPDEMLVPGSRAFLEELTRRGVQCYLASGTDEIFVKHEADLLDVTRYFQGVYGALDDYKTFDKHMVIQRIMRENNLRGPELVAFGDGYVEIEDTHTVGGIAVGVATNEAARQGIDEWKRSRLIQAGADIIIPDFSKHAALLEYLEI